MSYGMYGGTGYGMYNRSPYMYGSTGMYGNPYNSMYNNGMMMPGAGGPWDPNDPHGPPAPPSAWQAMLAGISGIVHFFGRLSFLVDENAHAVHFFISALLQLLDRFGSLYGELARFILRFLGFTKPSGSKSDSGTKENPVGSNVGGQTMNDARVMNSNGMPFDSVWNTR